MENTDRACLDTAFSLAYEELRSMARKIIRGRGSRGISATTLVNEAWIKLSSVSVATLDELHFRRVVAQAMRFILVDASRKACSRSRGSGDVLVTFDETLYAGCTFHVGPEMLDLNTALDNLASVAPRQAQLLEARVFGGLTAEEMVQIFEISESTVVRELRIAKAWVAREIGPSRKPRPAQAVVD